MDKHDAGIIAAVLAVPLLFLTAVLITSFVNDRYGLPKEVKVQVTEQQNSDK